MVTLDARYTHAVALEAALGMHTQYLSNLNYITGAIRDGTRLDPNNAKTSLYT